MITDEASSLTAEAPYDGIRILSGVELDLVSAGKDHDHGVSMRHSNPFGMGGRSSMMGGHLSIVIDIVTINIGQIIASGGGTVTVIGVQNTYYHGSAARSLHA